MATTIARSEDLPTEPAGDLVSFVDQVRQALRNIDPSDVDRWRDAYEGGLREAYRRNDIDGLVAIAGFAAALLDVQGHSRQALDQLDFAISMAEGSPDAQPYLLGLRAICASLLGDEPEARESLARAAASIGPGTGVRSRLGYDAYSASVSCILLDDRPPGEMTAPIPTSEREGLDWLASALRCWFIAYSFATGHRGPTRPWIDSLRMQAQAVGHPARLVDADVFSCAWTAPGTLGEPSVTTIEGARSTLNLIALWRTALLTLRYGLLSDKAPESDRGLELISETSRTLYPAFIDGMDAFRALAGAYRGEPVEGLKPPRQPSLVNCAAALAGGEAIAIAGSQEAAATWKAWFDASFPSIVKTTAEWPVAAARVKGLLHVRAGAVKSGIQLLQEAARWADEAGYPIEAALSRLQLAEVLTHASVPTSRKLDARKLRRTGWSALQELGIPPQSHAYAATAAVALSQDDRALSPLTPREIEVLGLLADGLTYKEIGLKLGMSWRTAQLHASRIYEKLDVHGKMQAFEVARELKIL
ncbi:MAG: LuxR C-terminal-related transcriptional regulator [Dehalococcoidia bacterium]